MSINKYMRGIKTTLVLLIMVLLQPVCFGQKNSSLFNETYQLIQKKDFFSARKVFQANKDSYSPDYYRSFIEAILDNAFNKPDLSEKKMASLIVGESKLPDSLMLKIYRIKEDNAMKQYDYKAAKNALEVILSTYENLLSKDEKEDLENNLKIWIALENQPRQKTVIKGDTRLKMERDKAELNNLKIDIGSDSANFIFDTGANISTITESFAHRFQMKIIPAGIKVDAITGASVTADLAVCKKIIIGNVTIENVVFLVFPDSALAFPQINYQINGILGFPVIESLKEVQLTQDGYFMVPEEETKISDPSNMAIDGLTPLIHINDMHFGFDTGANQSILYYPYYLKNKKMIDENHETISVDFSGAGGAKTYKGAKIETAFHILDKKIEMKDLRVLKERIKEQETYGNIGQDVIKRFKKLTLNFDHMFIKFD